MLMRLDEVGDHVAENISHMIVVDRVGDLPPLPCCPHDPGGAQQTQMMGGERL